MSSTSIKATVALLALSVCILAQNSAYNPTLNTSEQKRIQAGDIILREVTSPNPKGQTIEAIGVMKVPAESLVKLLTDYEAYPRFMSAVANVEILDQTGDTTTLKYILRPMLGFIKKYRVKIAPVQLDTQVWRIEWFLVKWPGLSPMETIGDTQGYWLIIKQTPSQSLVQYYVYSDPGPVPFGLGSIVNALGKDSIEEVFIETRAEAEKMLPQAGP